MKKIVILTIVAVTLFALSYALRKYAESPSSSKQQKVQSTTRPALR